ncbi:hypothetical protein C3R74_03090 [Acidithiobacillus ferridurans]|jgi:hypothetical protein|uniref:hypothetical protein n=1 Tax=Acidithiobacillus ferrooxidans TaxID=920 RepID=UPI0005A1C753|nr:hypothetical protein [Acidithiobacillus ferrooxidans]MCR0968166.1 hypothetical protein [Acidithiobacillus ferrooxidans]MCR1351335.1 hypothetical protein [Acidithiobacillus ferrooxidans]RBM03649.1 hypothetical protein C3R74_03090 [Acidithiobacillus ferridurans]
MIVTLHTEKLSTLEQLRAFADGTQASSFEASSCQEAYDCIADTLRRFHYELRRKADKGLITRFLCQVTGLSRQQVVRHIRQFRETRQVQDRRGAPAKPFARRYTDEDVHLLAELDRLHAFLLDGFKHHQCGTSVALGRCASASSHNLSRASNGVSLTMARALQHVGLVPSGARSHFLMVLRDRLVRRPISLMDTCSRKNIRRTFAYMTMVITSSFLLLKKAGYVVGYLVKIQRA